jgi:hypothetical protein
MSFSTATLLFRKSGLRVLGGITGGFFTDSLFRNAQMNHIFSRNTMPIRALWNKVSPFLPDTICILLAAGFTLARRYQGWSSWTFSTLDMLHYYRGGLDFLRSGALLDHGNMTSYGSYAPPGTFYFVLPGFLLPDPRLLALPANIFIFLCALFFFYALLRAHFTRGIALGATVVLAISPLGYLSIWPVGNAVYVWPVLYFFWRWIRDRSSQSMLAALVILAFGLYVVLGILPFVLCLPLVWLAFRPPVSWKHLGLAGLASLAIWFPYLAYENRRGFIDLQSLVLLKPIPNTSQIFFYTPPDYCYATLPGEPAFRDDIYIPYLGDSETSKRLIYSKDYVGRSGPYFLCNLLTKLDENFDGGLFLFGEKPLPAAILWTFFLIGSGLILLNSIGYSLSSVGVFIRRHRGILAGAFFLLAAAVWILLDTRVFSACCTKDGTVSEFLLPLILQAQGFLPLILAGVGMAFLLAIREDGLSREWCLFLSLSTLLPWAVLVMVVEPARPERSWFLWPGQLLLVVLAVRSLAQQASARIRAPVLAVSMIVLAVLLFPLSSVQRTVKDLQLNGYSGADTGQMAVVEYVVDRAKESQAPVFIGYVLRSTRFPEDISDPLFRVGSSFDFLLDVRGLKNANQTANGLDDRDLFRIVEDGALEQGAGGCPWADFAPAARFGRYLVCQKQPPNP